MRNIIRPVLCSALLLTSTTGFGSDELTEERFDQLHAELQPGNEPWRTIPWKIALLDAQQTAVAEKKPLFIWAMDGHPLGCT